MLGSNINLPIIFTAKSLQSHVLYIPQNTSEYSYTGCIKKTEQILNRSQRREAAQSMKFLINIDCLGTYDIDLE